jgi:hypothetical protein
MSYKKKEEPKADMDEDNDEFEEFEKDDWEEKDMVLDKDDFEEAKKWADDIEEDGVDDDFSGQLKEILLSQK